MTCEKADRNMLHQFIKYCQGGPLGSILYCVLCSEKFCAKYVRWTTGYSSINVYGYVPTRVYRGPKILKTYPEMKVVYLWVIII